MLAKIGPLARTLDFVANAAPGVKEILTVGKLAWEVREQHYDLVVVDASASGHIVGQLAAPDAIKELVQVGLVRDQTGWMMDILGDPAQTGVVIVAAPEEMPVQETIELAGRLAGRDRRRPRSRGRQPGAPRAVQQPRGGDVRAAARPTARPTPLEAAAGGPVGPVLDAAELAVTLRRSRAGHLDPPASRAARPTSTCSTCRTCSSGRTASGPPA